MTTNYSDTFIAVAPDCLASAATEPKPGTVAALQLTLLREQPYGHTSDDLLFEAHVRRNCVDDADRDAERATFLAQPRACLRASSLVKSHGWGLHHDGYSRVAAYGVETDEYRRLASDAGVKQTQGMRTKRASQQQAVSNRTVVTSTKRLLCTKLHPKADSQQPPTFPSLTTAFMATETGQSFREINSITHCGHQSAISALSLYHLP